VRYFFEVSPKSMQSPIKSPQLESFQRYIHRILGLSAILLSLVSFSWAQQSEPAPFVLSQRVGLEIDSIEAEYFNLFPDLDGVKSVVYRKDNLENLRMLVSLANGQDTTVTFSRLATQELTRYIDHHEVLIDSTSLVNWDLLPGYNVNKLNYFEDHGSVVFVRRLDGTLQVGKLLMVSDTMVQLWTSAQPFRPNLFPQNILRIPVREIDQIQRKQDLSGRIFGITLGAGLGIAALAITVDVGNPENFDATGTLLVLGGGAILGAGLGYLYDQSTISRRKYKIFGIYDNYLKIKPKLLKRVMFTGVYPPELYN